MPAKPLPTSDLTEVFTSARSAFESLREARLFLTGGTGFFGHWLLETLLFAQDTLQLNLEVAVLTRDPDGFTARAPDIVTHKSIQLVPGNICSFDLPKFRATHILHAATDSGGQQTGRPAYELSENIVSGTQRVLRYALECNAVRLLYVSTGAVYGRSTTLLHIPETYTGGPDPLQLTSSYDEAKRMAEHLCIAYAHGSTLQPVIARCFAFVGPHLPLDAHFAIGNFLGAAIRGDRLHIRGDGTARRSWLYMSDLATWLWTLLVSGTSGRAYNVGSDQGYTIAEAARLTAATLHNPVQAPSPLTVQIDGTPVPGAPLNCYVPAIDRARKELDLQVRVALPEALKRTAAWYGFRS